MAMQTSLGPVMGDVAGPSLSAEERERLCHPMFGGVILFARNCQDPSQVAALVAEIRALRNPALLVGIDQEGGRVQRLREGVTRLPPMAALGRSWERDGADAALAQAHRVGRLLALEMRALGLDLSFAPVMDLGLGVSAVIGDRAFHADPAVVGRLGIAFWDGMHSAGLMGVAKHFPGHGSTALDSHVDIPRDERPLSEIESRDLKPFEALVKAGIPGVMPAHVIYPAGDDRPAGFSPFWLEQFLRQRLRFRGCIFSDDLSMAGAGVVGEIESRAASATMAGCDVLLVCNDPAAADSACETALRMNVQPDQGRLEGMRGAGAPSSWPALQSQREYAVLRSAAEALWGLM